MLTPATAPTADEPYEYYARLSVERPFVYDETLGCWLACNVASVETVLGDGAFAVRPQSEPIPSAMHGSSLGELFGRMVRMTDGAGHASRRRDAETLVESMNVARLASALPDLQAAPLEQAMFVFPSRAVATLLGLSPQSVEGIEAHAQALARAIAPGAGPDTIAPASRAVDILDALCTQRFPDMQQRFGAISLLFQTYDATAGLIGNTLYALALAHPEARRRIVQDAPALSGFVAEVARLDPPVHNTRRFAARDVEAGGSRVRAGESVLVVLAAANYDAQAAGRTFTFGQGSHACVAARLAITIAAVAVKALVARGIDIAGLRRTGFHPALNVRIPRLRLAGT